MKRGVQREWMTGRRIQDLALLFFFAALGVVLGRWVCGAVAASDHEALRQYLQAYAGSGKVSGGGPVWPVAFAYIRYSLAAFLLGFFAAGVYAIPLVCMVQGFFLSFSVSCFASALGRAGVMLALAAFGLRCLLTLPCLFLTAVRAMDRSRTVGRELRGWLRWRADPVYYLRFAVCLVLLMMGTAADVILSQRLIALALQHIT
jgi:stage II sporulation protein M